MKNKRKAWLVGAAVILALAAFVLWPRLDLAVSGLFYRAGRGFFMQNFFLFQDLHYIAYAGARLLGLAFVILAVLSASQRKPLLGLNSRGWLFLFLGLVIGPGLVANTLLKDNWGRARPREIAEFGGALHFSPALVPVDECRHNCSFVAGDAAFGFYLPAIAYLVPYPRRSRRTFWSLMGFGCLFGLARIAMGAHFLSDVLFAAFFMQLTLALLHMAMYGAEKTRNYWQNWLFSRA